MTPRILAFAGSARKDSWNQLLVSIAAAGAEAAGADVTLVDWADYPMPLFDEDLEREDGMPEAVRNFKQLMADHDGFLIASPEYNSSISPLLKNAIDWASRAETPEEPRLIAYSGKAAVLMATSPGALGGLRGLVTVRSILANLGVIVLPQQRAVGQSFTAFDDEGRLADEKLHAAIEALGSDLSGFLRKYLTTPES